ncbi:MAG: right-handed parallel beta-helix repeat-containing protein [Chitinophagales bacterium]|nr:right-handed parallel beta-helix repeat-containing protein [Chitinophagales bacterium]
MKKIIYLLLLIILIVSCKTNTKKEAEFVNDANFQKTLQEQFIMAEDGATIEIPDGNWILTKSLSIEGKNNITIKGNGKDKCILSFLNQTEGAEGINVTNCNNITIEGFTIQDAKGDNLKLKACNQVIIKNMNSTWTTGADSANGNYGYYPVECHDVLIEHSDVSYCADAGVYVGQSINVTVRNCTAHHNVCGIEIENCINADVYDNYTYNNSGGIVVYDLPGLPLKHGRNCRVYNNKVEANNFKNFAKPGSYVSDIPPGSGIIIMAYDSVEVFNNTIKDNKTLGCCAVSYQVTGRPINDSLYSAFCTAINIHNNTFSRKITLIPDMTSMLGKLVLAISKTPLDIIFDGNATADMRAENGNFKPPYQNCFTNNGDIKFYNLNMWKAKKETDVLKTYTTDITPFDCSLPKLNGGGN